MGVPTPRIEGVLALLALAACTPPGPAADDLEVAARGMEMPDLSDAWGAWVDRPWLEAWPRSSVRSVETYSRAGAPPGQGFFWQGHACRSSCADHPTASKVRPRALTPLLREAELEVVAVEHARDELILAAWPARVAPTTALVVAVRLVRREGGWSAEEAAVHAMRDDAFVGEPAPAIGVVQVWGAGRAVPAAVAWNLRGSGLAQGCVRVPRPRDDGEEFAWFAQLLRTPDRGSFPTPPHFSNVATAAYGGDGVSFEHGPVEPVEHSEFNRYVEGVPDARGSELSVHSKSLPDGRLVVVINADGDWGEHVVACVQLTPSGAGWRLESVGAYRATDEFLGWGWADRLRGRVRLDSASSALDEELRLELDFEGTTRTGWVTRARGTLRHTPSRSPQPFCSSLPGLPFPPPALSADR